MKFLEKFDNYNLNLEELGDMIVYRELVDIAQRYSFSKIDTSIPENEVRYGFRNYEYDNNSNDWDTHYHSFSVSVIKDYILKNTITLLIDFEREVFAEEYLLIKDAIKSIHQLMEYYGMKFSEKSYPDPYVVNIIRNIGDEQKTIYRYNLMFE